MNIIPSTVGHRSRELPGGACRYCVRQVRPGLRAFSGPHFRVRHRAVHAWEVQRSRSQRNLLIPFRMPCLCAVVMNDDADGRVGHALSIVRHERACCVAAVVVPSTVGHRSRELPGRACRHCVEAGASRIACVIRTPLPGPSPCRSRLGSAAEPVAAHFVDSVQNALCAVDHDGVGHASAVVPAEAVRGEGRGAVRRGVSAVNNSTRYTGV